MSQREIGGGGRREEEGGGGRRREEEGGGGRRREEEGEEGGGEEGEQENGDGVWREEEQGNGVLSPTAGQAEGSLLISHWPKKPSSCYCYQVVESHGGDSRARVCTRWRGQPEYISATLAVPQ